MKKVIFPKDWIQLQPYEVADMTDQYYTNIANQIYEIIMTVGYDKYFDTKDEIKHLALCIAAYFEDVISQTNIWETFTEECKRRYGKFIPFYTDENTEYYPDEINKADIKFLLWHHAQYRIMDTQVLNPIFGKLDFTAQKIFSLLEKEYETAPENERFHNAICNEDGIDTDFDRYRELLIWFHNYCYFNIGNFERVREQIEATIENDTDFFDEVNKFQMMVTTTCIDSIMEGRNNLLSLTTLEWFKMICKKHPNCKLWAEVEMQTGTFEVKKEKKDLFIIKNLIDDNAKEVTVAKEILPSHLLASFQKKKTVLFTTFIKFGEHWITTGSFMEANIAIKNDFEKMQGIILEERERLTHKQAIKNYKILKDALKGKVANPPIVIASNGTTMEHFFAKELGIKLRIITPPQFANKLGVIVIGTPYVGIVPYFGVAELLAMPNNMFYNKEVAEKEAFNVIVNAANLPYEMVCCLIDIGALKDAALEIMDSTCQDWEDSHKMTQDNIQFITDYHFQKCRDKDMPPTELW